MKKSEENFYDQVQKKRLIFLILSVIAIVFNTGITFTFVIPGLKGFSLYLTIIYLAFYFLIANIFVGLFNIYNKLAIKFSWNGMAIMA